MMQSAETRARILRAFLEDLLIELDGRYDGAMDSPTRLMGGWLAQGREVMKREKK